MKIAMLSTPWIALPPQGYGGIELVISNLANELASRGHDVTVFATGDSTSKAKIKYYFEKALTNNIEIKHNPYHLLFHTHAFIKILQQEDFDIVHNHLDQAPYFFLDLIRQPLIHTLHWAYYPSLQSPTGLVTEKRKTQELFKNHAYVSISDHQRTGQPELNYVKTIYNSIDSSQFTAGNGSGGYLAWLGRVTPNKGLDTAIRIAKKLHKKLKISAFIDPGDQHYFDTEIQPLLDSSIELLEEFKNTDDKYKFYRDAEALLFPIRWEEPFGLVMIEAMASGTPVVAFNKGAAPEVIEHNRTGFVVNDEEEMITAIHNISSIDRQYCHDYAVKKFSIETMTDKYLEAYTNVINTFKKES